MITSSPSGSRARTRTLLASHPMRESRARDLADLESLDPGT